MPSSQLSYITEPLCLVNKEVTRLGLLTGSIEKIRYSPNGNELSCLAKYGTYITRVLLGEEFDEPNLTILEPKQSQIISDFVYSKYRPELITISMNGLLTIWDLTTNKEVAVYKTNNKEDTILLLSKDEKLVYILDDNKRLAVLDLSSGVIKDTYNQFTHSGISSMALTNSGRYIISAFNDSTIRKIDTRSFKQNGPDMNAHEGAIFTMAISPKEETLFSGDFHGNLCKWNLSTNKLISNISASKEHTVSKLGLTPCGNTLLAVIDKKLNIYNPDDLTLIDSHSCTLNNSKIQDLDFAPNSEFVTAFYSSIQRWKVLDSYNIKKSRQHHEFQI